MRRGVLWKLRNLLLVSAGACGIVGLLTSAIAAILQGDVLNAMRSAYCIVGAIGLILAALLLMAGRSRPTPAEGSHYTAWFGKLPVLLTLIVISAALIGCGGILDYMVR